jgi:hypothetical protein
VVRVVPLAILMDPVRPDTADPVPTVTAPLVPATVVPLLSTRKPDSPTNALADRRINQPEDETPPSPEAMCTWPPVLEGSRVAPANTWTLPPSPRDVAPASIVTEPPVPLFVAPTRRLMLPERPDTAWPVDSLITPTLPTVVLPVCSNTSPVVPQRDESPEPNETTPLFPVAVPDDSETEPDDAASVFAAVPLAIMTAPEFPELAVPELKTNRPDSLTNALELRILTPPDEDT